MKIYLIPVYIGFSIMIVGLYSMSGVIVVAPTYIISVSIAGYAFVVAGFLEEYLSEVEYGHIVLKILVQVSFFIALFSLVALPTILDGFKIGDSLKSVGDALAIGSIGMVILSMGTKELFKQAKRIRSEIQKNKIEIERLKNIPK